MEYMESKMQDQIEGAINEREECYKRISVLEDVIKRALKISDLWRPEKDTIPDSEMHAGECQALESMYYLFKNSLE